MRKTSVKLSKEQQDQKIKDMIEGDNRISNVAHQPEFLDDDLSLMINDDDLMQDFKNNYAELFKNDSVVGLN